MGLTSGVICLGHHLGPLGHHLRHVCRTQFRFIIDNNNVSLLDSALACGKSVCLLMIYSGVFMSVTGKKKKEDSGRPILAVSMYFLLLLFIFAHFDWL